MFTVKMEELCLKGEGTVLRHGTEVLDLFGLDMLAAEQPKLEPERTELLRGLLSAGSVRALKITQNFGSVPNFKLRVCFDGKASPDQLIAAFAEIARVTHHYVPVPALVGQFTGGALPTDDPQDHIGRSTSLSHANHLRAPGQGGIND